ncbi:xanthine dehydrogenase family protein molybdopterin-binding subunit [Bosea sp. Leaf344]|uniref:xanthine dehydrogenase family protein molybdopterin-binding subunit n=1 Tax=Bosea sp. Leaf344 TaxID=1736346 RepID=UPI0009E69EA3|nr:xanthine dehydrogenase family protein molybdopterin-binding subunit [Bosea sp. Leaf344]
MSDGDLVPQQAPPGAPFDDPRSLRRREDHRFLTGAGDYLDDRPADGMLHAAVLRSPHAHARIVAIDSEAAAGLPGVVAIYSHADIAALGPMPTSLALSTGAPLHVPERPVLAGGHVRHVGDGVAFVVAESADAARLACEAIIVDYDILPAVTDLAAAAAPGAPQLWSQAQGNIAYRYERGDAQAVADAFAVADEIVTLDLVNNRIVAAALEPRVAIGRFDPATATYHLAISAASVHAIRQELAQGVFRLPLHRLHVSSPDVGGGFGMKNVTYPEYALVLWAARQLGRPVRWVADRIEEFTGGAHARDNLTTASLAIDRKGRFLALSMQTLGNVGAYVSSLGPGSATNAAANAMGGLYAIPAIRMEVTGVFTNTAPIDAYRGAGKPEANYLLERLVDEAAHRLKRDPAALRKLNFITSFPYRSAFGITIDCGDFSGNLDRVLAAADQAGFPARRRQARKRGRLRGFGIGCFLETSRGPPNEEAWLTVQADGTIEMAVGTQSNGQGHETSFAQVLAARLGLSVDAFRLVQADTQRVPRGGGHGGARSLHLGGGALVLAAEDLLAKALPVAAQLLQVRPEALRFEAGRFVSREEPLREIGLLAVAAHVRESSGAPLSSHGDHRCDLMTFPNGAQVAEVEVDPETGLVNVLRYVAVDDYGTLVNPLLTEAQVHGGLAQGLGQALMEEAAYDADSGQLLSASFMDYAMPRAADLPDFELAMVEIPTRSNPLGVKGSGQAGCIGAPQTVMHAILDALRPLGVRHLDMPATPARIWHAIRQARGG